MAAMISLQDIWRPRYTVLAAGILIFVASYAAADCRCVPPGTPKYELDQAKAVFSGKVVSMKKAPGMTQRVTLKMLKSWKGPRKRQMVITVSIDPAECGFEFKQGHKYLVYALSGEAGRLTTTLCSRTTPLELADRDLQELFNNGVTARHPPKN